MIKQLALAGCLVVSTMAFAQTRDQAGGSTSKKPTGDLSVKDRQFVENASTANLAEIKLSKLALQKSTSPDVKKYAQMIIDDHEKASKELKSIAKTENMATPDTLDSAHAHEYDRLSAMSGKDFDREYMQLMVKDHDKAVDLFQKASTEVTDPQLKSYADKTLPTLKQHKEHATMDEKEMKKK